MNEWVRLKDIDRCQIQSLLVERLLESLEISLLISGENKS